MGALSTKRIALASPSDGEGDGGDGGDGGARMPDGTSNPLIVLATQFKLYRHLFNYKFLFLISY